MQIKQKQYTPFLFAGCVVTLLFFARNMLLQESAVISSFIMSGTVLFCLGMAVAYVAFERFQQKKLVGQVTKAAYLERNQERSYASVVSMANHQIKKPLSIISGYAELTQDVLDKQAVATGYLDQIGKQVQEARETLDQFFQYTSVQQSTVRVRRRMMNILYVLRPYLDTWKKEALAKGLHVVVNIDPTIYLFIDDGLFLHAMKNLLENARAYTKTGSISVVAKKNVNQIEISISDTGIGFTAEELAYSWQKFRRGKAASMLEKRGTGLGMFIAREFVVAHGGRICLKSNGRDLGTTVSIIFPLAKTGKIT